MGIDPSISLKGICVNYRGVTFGGALRPAKKLDFAALEDLSLEIRKGETIALMGNNGAGKSTLLSFLSGKLMPSMGHARIVGKTVHLSGVNPGFDVLMSPRQNINWLSSIYGSDAQKILSDVEEFADIGEAFDRPIRTLSTGMRGRVGFGFATSLNPDILLIDEVLGVGDPSFKSKATIRLKEMISRSGIVLISTHSVGLVKELTDRCLIIDKGRIIHDGDSSKGVQIYSENR